MLKTKRELETYLENKCITLAFKKEACEQIAINLLEKYEIPFGTTMDMLTLQKSLSEVNDFLLFCLLDGIHSVTQKEKIDKFFTDLEIKQYSKSKYEAQEKLSFPITIPCYPVTDDQWIGVIDTNFLMKLRNAQKITYNENTQRTLQKIVRGEEEIFKISLDENAVSAIRSSYDEETYIPNTITLNIPVDSEGNYYYDHKNKTLVITSLDHFDISDGYHRYIALCREKDLKPDFNYPMEIRITNFAEEKAQLFIFQEDQKTKMKKVDSDSMNTNKAANIVTERLNQDMMFSFKGMVNRNAGAISFGELAALIHYFYFKDTYNKPNNIMLEEVKKEVRNYLNSLTSFDEKYLSKKYNFKDLCIIMYVFKRNENDIMDKCVLIDRLLTSNNIPDTKFRAKVPRKTAMNEIEKAIEEAS